MNKIALIVMAGFALAFVAGGSVGMLAGPEVPAGPPRGPGEWLVRELQLAPEQRRQMREIWSVLDEADIRRRQHELIQRRDQAIQETLTEQQRTQYRQIVEEFRRGQEEIHRDMRSRMERAVQRTKEILTPEQAKRYEEIRCRRLRGGPGRHGPGRKPSGGPFGPGRRGGPRTRKAPRGRFHDGPGPFGGQHLPGGRLRPRRGEDGRTEAPNSTQHQ